MPKTNRPEEKTLFRDYRLHPTNEESDLPEYRAYARRQSDADLRDMLHHIDAVHYPARADALARELVRRACTRLLGNGEWAAQSVSSGDQAVDRDY